MMGRQDARHQAKSDAAAVTMPEGNVRDRKDFPDIIAAIQRVGPSAAGIGQVAARFRLPYAVVSGLAKRGGKK